MRRPSAATGSPLSSIFTLILLATLALFPSTAHAAFQLQSDYIYTEQVAYCSAGRAVEVDRFDIRYYRQNKSIGFDISARSVAENLNADINIQLFAYGETRINLTVNVCDIVNGALCPLPQYQFDGSFVYLLPDSFDIKLPGLAWTVPDLDASATIILINQETGAEALCLSAVLSNGKSVYLPQVQWAVGGLAIGAFLVALIHSFWPISPYKSGPEWRFATILTYFQHVALCGFLSLDYPNVYKNFTLNFAWAQGLIRIGPIDRAINRMRYATGGVNREGQTYNVTSESEYISTLLAQTRSFAAGITSSYAIPSVQDAPSYNLISGIETTSEDVGITYANAFMTVFIVFLLFLAVITAIILLATAGVLLYALFQKKKRGDSPENRTSFYNLRYFIWTNLLRTALVAYTPLVLFVFWQFLHENDSGWLAVFIAVLVFVWIHLAIAGIYYHVGKIANRAMDGGREKLSLRWTTVTKQFKKSGGGYIFILAAAAFASSAFVAFAQGHGLVQLIPLIVIELLVFISFCIWRPFANRWSNVLMIFISLFKIVAYGILIAFWARIEINGIIRAVLGFVIIAVQGIMVVLLFIVTLYNLGAGLIWSRKARRDAEEENARLTSMNEKRQDIGRSPFFDTQKGRSQKYEQDNLRNGVGSAEEMQQHQQPYGPPVSSLYIPVPPSPSMQNGSHEHAGSSFTPLEPNASDSDENRTVVGNDSDAHLAGSTSDLTVRRSQLSSDKRASTGQGSMLAFWNNNSSADRASKELHRDENAGQDV